MALIHALHDGIGVSAKYLFSFPVLPGQLAYYGMQSRCLSFLIHNSGI